jgi:hypothetical protein
VGVEATDRTPDAALVVILFIRFPNIFFAITEVDSRKDVPFEP